MNNICEKCGGKTVINEISFDSIYLRYFFVTKCVECKSMFAVFFMKEDAPMILGVEQ